METAAPPQIFDRARLRRARARSARRATAHDFLHRRTMSDIVDRLESVTRGFETALFYGASGLTDMLTPACGIGRVIAADLAPERLRTLSADVKTGSPGRAPQGPGGPGALAFDEERQPFAPQSFDLIVSLLTLHAANDLVGALAQYRLALKPDGLFIAALFGEETLAAFKAALIRAELEAAGGAGARIAPFATVRDLGAALQRAGFAMPVADIDRAVVRYADPWRLIEDLRGMGEFGVLNAPARPLRREALARALADLAMNEASAEFDIVYLTGWAPHPSQPKSLRPGSAKASLAEAVRRAGD